MPDDVQALTPAASPAAASETTQAASTSEGGLSSAPGAGLDTQQAETPVANGESGADATELPFHNHPRWQEVQRERQDLARERDAMRQELEERKQWDPVVEQFKTQGMTSAQAVQAAIAERDWQQQETTALEGIARGLAAQIERGDLTEEAAEERFQRIQLERRTARESEETGSRLRSYEVKESIPDLRRQFPEMDEDDVVEAALRSPKTPLAELAQKSHDRAMRVIARHSARQSAKPALPAEGGGGAPVNTSRSVDDMSPDEFKTWKADQIRQAAKAGR